MNAAPTATATNATSRTVMRTGRDTSHHLASMQRTGARVRAGRALSAGPRPEACYEPDLPSIRCPAATPRRLNDEIVMIMASWQLMHPASPPGFNYGKLVV